MHRFNVRDVLCVTNGARLRLRWEGELLPSRASTGGSPSQMLREKVVRFAPTDLMGAFKIIGLKVVRRTQGFPRASGLADGPLDGFNRKDVIARAAFDQQRARRDQAG